jgi:hypothetical protein
MSRGNGRSESCSYFQFGDNNQVSYAASSRGSASPPPTEESGDDLEPVPGVFDISTAFYNHQRQQSLNSSPAMSFRGNNELEQTTDRGRL